MIRCCAVVLMALFVILLGGAAAQTAPARDTRSLGDVARELRGRKTVDVQINATDAAELFAALDEILNFASGETGYQRLAPVKRQVVGRDEVNRAFSEAADDTAERERLIRSELVLKKFGLLPPSFDLRAYFQKDFAKEIGGYYNSKTRTMYLVNWVPLDQQRPVMAHELTHALQDQNYGLLKFISAATAAARRPPKLRVDAADNAELGAARRAMVEGQAMVVYMEYLAKRDGFRLTDSAALMDTVLGSLRSYDAPVVLHDAPRVLKESAYFPYQEGLAFVMEVLQKGGRWDAFPGLFARPPQTSHEVLHPAAYLKKQPAAVVTIPDLSRVLPAGYEAYDSGIMGELDVRIMARDFGRENDMFTVAQKWNGGAYVVLRRTPGDPAQPLTTADLAVVYVSRWETAEAAQRFAQIYQKSLPQRVRVLNQRVLRADCPAASARCDSPLWAARITTAEGPASIEIWPGNTVLITHGFDEPTLARLRPAVLTPEGRSEDKVHQRELSSLLLESHTFTAIQEQIARQLESTVWQRR